MRMEVLCGDTQREGKIEQRVDNGSDISPAFYCQCSVRRAEVVLEVDND